MTEGTGHETRDATGSRDAAGGRGVEASKPSDHVALPADSPHRRGAIAWMAQHPVASNLLMVALVVGGLLVGRGTKQEVFPAIPADTVMIQVPYPGASPAEVEQGIILAVEEAVRGIDGVKEVSSGASESMGTVAITLLLGADADRALTDVRNAVARVTSFPQEAEEPLISLMEPQRQVISVIFYGDQPEQVLHAMADRARDTLLAGKDVTRIDLTGVRAREVAVEIPRDRLRELGLTLPEVARRIRAAAVEVPGGGVKTRQGELLLRTDERRDYAQQFGDIPVAVSADGNPLLLRDVAVLRDGYAEVDTETRFNGKPAAVLKVYRVGDQTPISVADAVHAFVDDVRGTLPPGVEVATWFDWSVIYRQRIGLLVRNGLMGLALVLVVLGLFLHLRLAFWVTLGIPISFCGSLLLLPGLDVSINMVTLFAFIVTLGMVVDDAIIVGENIHEWRGRGISRLEAAIRGAREVGTPVIFAILTTIAAFTPLLFVPGTVGKIFRMIPLIVISVLLLSLVESLWILPAHLAHEAKAPERGVGRLLWGAARLLALPLQPFLWVFERLRRVTTAGLAWFIEGPFARAVTVCLSFRYAAVAFGVACLAVAFALIAGGHIGRSNMPRIDSDRITAAATLPFGAPLADTRAVQEQLVAAAERVLASQEGDISLGIYSTLGQPMERGGPVGGGIRAGGSHLAGVQVYLVPSDQRSIGGREFSARWRKEIGEISGLENLSFDFTIGMGGGKPIDVELQHTDLGVLEHAAGELATALRGYSYARDVDDGFQLGKPQLSFRVRPEAQALGLTSADLTAQVRGSFFGAEALRQQRARDEVRVMVRLPLEERSSEYDLEVMTVRAPTGAELPLHEAATPARGHAYTAIGRVDGRRVVRVTGDVLEGKGDLVLDALQKDHLPGLVARFPGLQWSFKGEREEQEETGSALGRGMLMALLAIYSLLAIPFRSYIQPLVVMSAIPFGLIGALIGHYLMGFNISNISLMGLVALSGVVVNDSLVLIDAANRFRLEGQRPFAAIKAAAMRRFRPILLTSLTTFGGLTPMIFETSVQAKFLIPMAVSLGFGVLFATVIILLLVPALYLIIEDLRALAGFTDPVRGPSDDDAEGEGEDDTLPLPAPA